MPKGIILNNPGNLKPSEDLVKEPFKGQIPLTGAPYKLISAFFNAIGKNTFKAPADLLEFVDVDGQAASYWGLRALAITLLRLEKEKVKTLEALGDLLADNEGHPNSQPGDFGKWLSAIIQADGGCLLPANVTFSFNQFLYVLMRALVVFHQGYGPRINPFWYQDSIYLNAIKDARAVMEVDEV